MADFKHYVACCVAALACLPGIVAAAGNYGPVAIDEDEQKLIESSAELEGYFRSQSLVYEEEPLRTLVRRIGRDLAPPPTDDYIEYEFFILRDPSPNAFALPNGHVYVHTGMLARLRDESQLAALLGHELNHVAGHHSIISYRVQTKRTVAAMVFGGLGGWGNLISVGLQTSIFGFSRDLEQESDDHAAELLVKAGYDPHALPELFEILGTDYEGLYPRMPTVWSTHPEVQARAVTSRALVADLPHFDREVESFEEAAFPLRLLTIRDYIQDDYPQTALALAQNAVERYPGVPDVLQVLGDAWQALGAQAERGPDELSNKEKRSNQRERVSRTREQRLAERLATEQGRAAYASNLARAEETYRRALAIDPNFAPARRGLGEVYEQLERDRDAAREYVAYVRLAPDAPDRVLVVNRLRTLREKLQQEDDNDD
jgi:predicted Zn-dependent protease